VLEGACGGGHVRGPGRPHEHHVDAAEIHGAMESSPILGPVVREARASPMKLLPPVPRSLSRVLTAAIVVAWLVQMGVLLRSFQFSMDPGTGAIEVSGIVQGRRLQLTVKTPSGASRTETRDLPERPSLSLNLSRELAAAGLAPGKHVEASVFDPATLRNET